MIISLYYLLFLFLSSLIRIDSKYSVHKAYLAVAETAQLIEHYNYYHGIKYVLKDIQFKYKILKNIFNQLHKKHNTKWNAG